MPGCAFTVAINSLNSSTAIFNSLTTGCSGLIISWQDAIFHDRMKSLWDIYTWISHVESLCGRAVYCVVGRCTVCYVDVLCGRAVYCVVVWCTAW